MGQKVVVYYAVAIPVFIGSLQQDCEPITNYQGQQVTRHY